MIFGLKFCILERKLCDNKKLPTEVASNVFSNLLRASTLGLLFGSGSGKKGGGRGAVTHTEFLSVGKLSENLLV